MIELKKPDEELMRESEKAAQALYDQTANRHLAEAMAALDERIERWAWGTQPKAVDDLRGRVSIAFPAVLTVDSVVLNYSKYKRNNRKLLLL